MAGLAIPQNNAIARMRCGCFKRTTSLPHDLKAHCTRGGTPALSVLRSTSSQVRQLFALRRSRGSTIRVKASATLLAAATVGRMGLFEPHVAFTLVTVLMVPLYGLVMAFPKTRLTKDVVQSPTVYVILAMLYTVLLVHSLLYGGLLDMLRHIATAVMRPPNHVPDMAGVAALFHDPTVTTLAWVHLLLLDFFQAREVLLDGLRSSVFTAHSVLLCFFCGPLGLLSHVLTKLTTQALRGKAA